jgi:hypothetical protein
LGRFGDFTIATALGSGKSLPGAENLRKALEHETQDPPLLDPIKFCEGGRARLAGGIH